MLVGLYFTFTVIPSKVLIDERLHSEIANLEVASLQLVEFIIFHKLYLLLLLLLILLLTVILSIYY